MSSSTQGSLLFAPRQPLVLSYGMGVDSTAIIVEFVRLGIRPDLVLFADTGTEADQTYAYLPIINGYLAANGFPEVTVVRYEPQDFKNWPPYSSLEENCLTNATLPSLAFGFKSCSQKWKIAPQEKYVSAWQPALECWALGGRVKKVIGYDAGPADLRRRNHAGKFADERYEYEYPLQLWGWDRTRCAQEILRAGLPVPQKSSCYICPAMRPAEVVALSPDKLRRIVIIEARAKPRLMGYWPQSRLDEFYLEVTLPKWEKKKTEAVAQGKPAPKKPKQLKEGEGCRGLWRNKSMTEFIRAEELLPKDEVDALIANTPTALLTRDEIESWNSLVLELTTRSQSECVCAA